MRLQSKHEWLKHVLLITPVLLYIVSCIFKRPFFVGKNLTLFYFLRSCFTKACKSVLLLRNNGTRFHYKIQRRKLAIFSHTWYEKHCEVTSKSGLTFYWGEGVGLWKTTKWRFLFQNRFTSGTLGPLFFLIYINNMPNGLKSNVKLFAGDTSIFSIIKNKDNSAKDLTHDLSLISKWAINPLVLNAPFLYPWKDQKTLWFSDLFRGWRKSALKTNRLKVN